MGSQTPSTEQLSKLSAGMDEVRTLVKARTPIMYVVTHEESRFIDELYETVASPLSLQVWTWSSYQGLLRYQDPTSRRREREVKRASGEMEATPNPSKMLETVMKMEVPAECSGILIVLKDFNTVMREPIPRQLRDCIEYLASNQKSIIVLAPELGYSQGQMSGLPTNLDKDVVVVEYGLLNKGQIGKVVGDKISSVRAGAKKFGKQLKTEYSTEEQESLVRACQGLTCSEIENALATSLVSKKEFNPESVLQIKEQIIRKSQILEYVKSDVRLDHVGGLDLAKAYFGTYRGCFSDAAQDFGVEPPAGILLTGVPGTGKSLLAKAIAREWGLPGLRLDVGKVMTGLVGGSEQRMREAIKQAEALAPDLVWIDEVEKAMSGVKSSNFSDAGTMSRVFGTFLTWMQEKTAKVVVLATANDITQVPPEFIRRFNEVFFVDLPSPDERKEIFIIHLLKRRRMPENFDLQALVEASQNYTGAEIEKSIQHGLAMAFARKDKDLTTEHILEALNGTKPIYTVMHDKIEAIRDWAKNRARYASSQASSMSKARKARQLPAGKITKEDASLDEMDVGQVGDGKRADLMVDDK